MRDAYHLALDGDSLTVGSLVAASRSEHVKVGIGEDAHQRVADAHAVVCQAVQDGTPVYGLTTGLGSRVGERLDEEALQNFSEQTLRGRAHALGAPLPVELVRGAMIVRLNTLLKGGAGASPELVAMLAQCLERNRIPDVGSVGSIGASDLCQGATLGLALVEEFGFTPGLRDGLALANHSSFSAAAMGRAVHDAGILLNSVQSAAALSLCGFQANLSPLHALASQMRPQAGQREVSKQLEALLQGSTIVDIAQARRLQDPLSIRNIPQTHGAALAALNFARAAATDEINGASDNPVVDMENDRVISCGAYHTPLLAIASQALSQALVHVAHTQLSRIARLLGERFSGLPQFLASPGDNATAASNGFAPVLKVAESLVARISHQAAPVAVWPSVNAEGAEDIQTNALTAIQGLDAVIDNARLLCAIELMVGAQALDLRWQLDNRYVAGPGIVTIHQMVREVSPMLRDDRSLSREIESVADRLGDGRFDASVLV